MAEITAAEIKRLRALEAENERLRNQIDGVFEGYLVCVNKECEAFDSRRPCAMQTTYRTVQEDPHTKAPLGINDYTHPVDDADWACPSCGKGRTRSGLAEPPEYAQLAPR